MDLHLTWSHHVVKVKAAKLQATALKADEVRDGLREVVYLLTSRPML
jgi:ribosomal protein L7Ae-like RNA K-turn-binding protein